MLKLEPLCSHKGASSIFCSCQLLIRMWVFSKSLVLALSGISLTLTDLNVTHPSWKPRTAPVTQEKSRHGQWWIPTVHPLTPFKSRFLPQWRVVLKSVSALTRVLADQKLIREPQFEKLLKISDQSSKLSAHFYLSLASEDPPWGSLYKCPDEGKCVEKSMSTMGSLLCESSDVQHYPYFEEDFNCKALQQCSHGPHVKVGSVGQTQNTLS